MTEQALTEKVCTPCRGGIDPLTRAQAEILLPQAPGWSLDAEARTLLRSFAFDDFARALDFVQRVGDVAEAEGHHPDIKFGWGYCDIRIQTHKIGGLHQNDFILAAKISQFPSA